MFALKIPDMHVDEQEAMALEQEVTMLVKQGDSIAANIQTESQANAASDWARAARRRKKDYENNSYAARMKQSLSILMEQTTAELDRFVNPIKAIVIKVDTAVGAFLSAENRRRAAIDEENRRQAREEETAQRLNAAIKLEEMGAKNLAENMLSKPLDATGPVMPKAKIANSVFKTVWEVDTIDKKQLIKAVADGKISMNALTVNEAWLKREANDSKGNVVIDGVTFKSTEKFNTRS